MHQQDSQIGSKAPSGLLSAAIAALKFDSNALLATFWITGDH